MLIDKPNKCLIDSREWYSQVGSIRNVFRKNGIMWEKFPSGQTLPPPPPVWEFFRLNTVFFLKMSQNAKNFKIVKYVF